VYAPTVADLALGSGPLRRRQALARGIAHALGRIEVLDPDRVPARGAVVLAMNHRAFLDGPLVFGFVRRPVSCLVKVEAFTPRLGPVLRGAGQIPVVRQRVDRAPVRRVLRILRADGVVGVFPEGSRGDGQVRVIKGGVAWFALRTGATVVPVAFHGTEALGRRRRPPVRLAFGRPLPVERVDGHRPLNRRVVAAEAERIRGAMVELVRETGLVAA
jgi:1-acyl-sn-glycerol-3-phosphate acyltransferase